VRRLYVLSVRIKWVRFLKICFVPNTCQLNRGYFVIPVLSLDFLLLGLGASSIEIKFILLIPRTVVFLVPTLASPL